MNIVNLCSWKYLADVDTLRRKLNNEPEENKISYKFRARKRKSLKIRKS